MTTEEADFLEALRAEPGDDDLRLVFADWLEERGDARSDYLRAVVEAARALDRGIDPTAADLVRLRSLAREIDAAWRRRAGVPAEIVLEDVPDGYRVLVIRNLRQVRRCTLIEAFRLTSDLPRVIVGPAPLEDVAPLRPAIEAQPPEWPDAPGPCCRTTLRRTRPA